MAAKAKVELGIGEFGHVLEYLYQTKEFFIARAKENPDFIAAGGSYKEIAERAHDRWAEMMRIFEETWPK